jgi:uncharacterized repeat protein (TIGR01451 family)
MLRKGRQAFGGRTLLLLPVLLLGLGLILYAGHGEPHATYTYWDIGADPNIAGFDPHETLDDVEGLTVHVGAPSMVTAMENTRFGLCGLLFWNPDTNNFKTYGIGGGLNFAVDINTGAPQPVGSKQFGGGDVWSAIKGGGNFHGQMATPYMNFRGSNDFRYYNIAGVHEATGVRVNPDTGLVYMGNFGDFTTPMIVELNPKTNAVRKWPTGSKPYFLALDGKFVYATGIRNPAAGQLDQIIRLNPDTGEITRWNIPGGGFQPFVSFGTPNYIAVDPRTSEVWFTETDSNEVARLNPGTGCFDEYSKPPLVDHPHAVAVSGAGATLQTFFTEAHPPTPGGAHVSVLSVKDGTPVTTCVTPVTTTVPASMDTATFADFTETPFFATITPKTFDSPGRDPSGITQFPIPPDTSHPTGMTRVWRPQTVAGSMEGTHHVFVLKSEAIVAPPPGAEADLSVEKSDLPDPALAGGPLQYSITVTNNGPDTATSVTLIDILPPEVTFITAVATQGMCTESGGTVTCELGDIPPGGTVLVEITVQIDVAASGEICNVVEVRAVETDPKPDNNKDRECTTVLSVAPGKVTGGGSVTVPGGTTAKPGTASFGFNVKRTELGGAVTGHLNHKNHVSGAHIVSTLFNPDLVITGNSATWSGQCTLNGSPLCTFRVYVEDNGQGGSNDMYRITYNAITEGGILRTGNIQIHKTP